MLQEEQISILIKLKEMLDSGVLSEDEFTKAKAKVLEDVEKKTSSSDSQPNRVRKSEVWTKLKHVINGSMVGPANVALSPKITWPLIIIAVVLFYASMSFLSEVQGMDASLDKLEQMYFENEELDIDEYHDMTDGYENKINNKEISASVYGLLSLVSVCALWMIAFKKLSARQDISHLNKRLSLFAYLSLGGLGLLIIMGALGLAIDESFSFLIFLCLITAAVCGVYFHVLLLRTFSGKMRIYSIVWMVCMLLIWALSRYPFVVALIATVGFVFLMMALLEKEKHLPHTEAVTNE